MNKKIKLLLALFILFFAVVVNGQICGNGIVDGANEQCDDPTNPNRVNREITLAGGLSDVIITVTTDKDVYKTTDTIEVVYTITNNTPDPINFTLGYSFKKDGEVPNLYDLDPSNLPINHNILASESVSIATADIVPGDLFGAGGKFEAGSYQLLLSVPEFPGEYTYLNNKAEKWLSILVEAKKVPVPDTNLFLLPILLIIVLGIILNSYK